MLLKISTRFCLAALVCCFLAGCRSDFHLVIFNNTDDAIILHRRTQDPTPLVVVAGISGEITGVSTDDFIIERNGKLLHYHFPVAYTYPSAAVPPGYERHVARLGPSFCFQLGPDNRIYMLRQHESLEEINHSAQPAGFPLVPRPVLR